ncbi:MAG: peptide ABC transporter substrate-binding protein [Leptospiraceae bacterium]|nr:peptide ABC transporter substrate-binding protein [Leptospiraceae bacterium]
MKSWIVLAILLILPTSLFAQTKIEVLLSSDNRIYEQSLYGIQTVIETELKVTYLDILLAEQPDISQYFNEIERSGAPFIITIGPAATKMAKDNLKKTPIIFSMVNSPKFIGLDTDRTCGVSMDVPISEFFSTLHDIDPKAGQVYAYYSTAEGEYSASEGVYLDLKHKLIYKNKKIDDKKDLKPALEELKGKIDAFYMVNDPLYGKTEFDELSEFCKRNGIVLMTAFPALVKLGATFGISPDYSKIGILTGNMANRIFSKESSCESEGIALPDQYTFYLNEKYAQESGIKIPEPIVERAKLARLFDVGINLMNENKLNSARIIFDTILKRDPNNKPAFTYQQLIIEKITGARTKEYLANAEKYYKGNQFSQARAEYQKVLHLNPNNQIAKKGVQDSLLAQSEQERQQGNSLAREGKPFDAIKMYQTALQTLPTNGKATSDLAALRSAEIPNLKTYLKDGVDNYNKRNYDKSIEIFESILLVDPNHKEATEYLRLSNKKREAITILKEKLKKKDR